ncbi:hypothetical protein D3C86_981520 [compost metagenome]
MGLQKWLKHRPLPIMQLHWLHGQAQLPDWKLLPEDQELPRLTKKQYNQLIHQP